MEKFTRELVLHDKNGKKNNLTIENERGYFSICNDHGQNTFEPKNELQQELLNIWDTYHIKNIDKLPDNFEEKLFSLLDQLQEQEDEYNERLITEDDINNEEFIEHADENCEGNIEKLMATCLECGVSWNGLENVTSNNGTYWEIEGQNYYIYTDEEADDAHLERIESLVDDIGFEGFNGSSGPYVKRLDNGNIEISMSIEIGSDERGSALASYDGEERYEVVNGTTYYLYKC